METKYKHEGKTAQQIHAWAERVRRVLACDHVVVAPNANGLHLVRYGKRYVEVDLSSVC